MTKEQIKTTEISDFDKKSYLKIHNIQGIFERMTYLEIIGTINEKGFCDYMLETYNIKVTKVINIIPITKKEFESVHDENN